MKYENTKLKNDSELEFWKEKVEQEIVLNNNHYENMYINYLELNKEDFVDKAILDIGCGPRGSLEWANMASLRVGLDPLVNEYYKLDGGTLFHKMKYVNAKSEDMPFPNNVFDYVFSVNSLDHVDDLKETICEITRVLKIGGLLGIIVEVNHDPTLCEPIQIPLTLSEDFKDSFEIIDERIYEIYDRKHMYDGIFQQNFYDFKNSEKRPALIVLKMKKNVI